MTEITSPFLWRGFKVLFLSAPWILGIELPSSPSRAFACDQECTVQVLGVKKGLELNTQQHLHLWQRIAKVGI